MIYLLAGWFIGRVLARAWRSNAYFAWLDELPEIAP
jgi:hypothetical protein